MLLIQAVITRIALSFRQHNLSEDAFLGDFWWVAFSFLNLIYFGLFYFSRLVFLYHLVHTSQVINVVFCASYTCMPTAEIFGPLFAFLNESPEKCTLLVEEQCLRCLLIRKYDFSDEVSVTWTTVKLKITDTFCKANTVCLTFNELAFCRLMYNFLCDHSLKCILIYWLPDLFVWGWNCCSLWLALDRPFCLLYAVQVLLLRKALAVALE